MGRNSPQHRHFLYTFRSITFHHSVILLTNLHVSHSGKFALRLLHLLKVVIPHFARFASLSLTAPISHIVTFHHMIVKVHMIPVSAKHTVRTAEFRCATLELREPVRTLGLAHTPLIHFILYLLHTSSCLSLFSIHIPEPHGTPHGIPSMKTNHRKG